MLRKQKGWSVVLAVCLCLALLAPVFIAPPGAQAASQNTVEQSLTADQTTSANLGIVKVKVTKDALDLASGGQLSVSFPSDIRDPREGDFTTRVPVANTYSGSGVQVVVPSTSNAFGMGNLVTTPMTNSKFTINVTGFTSGNDDGVFYIYFYGLNTTNFAGDNIVTLLSRPDSLFTTDMALIVGEVKKDAGTNTFAKSVYNITGSGGINNGMLNTISIQENAANAMNDGNVELKIMTKGYEWNTTSAAVLYDWGFGFGPPSDPATLTLGGSGSDTLTITGLRENAPAYGTGTFSTPGLIHLASLALDVDDSVARVGQDIEVRIKGAGVTEQTFTVARYCDFESQVLEGTVAEIMAGREEQRIGEFYIEELAPGTLVQDRVLTIELPEGYEWDANSEFGSGNYEVVNSSSITLSNVRYPERDGSDKNMGRVMKLEVTDDSSAAANGAKIKFKKLEVMASPAAKGDLVLEISGKAGVEGSVKVATTTPMFTMEAEPVDVVLGVQNQKVSDIVLKESKAGAFVDRKDRTKMDRTIVLQLDEDFAFDRVPQVDVTAGDIVLEMDNITIGGDRDSGGQLFIPIKAGSYKEAAEITLSDIYVTANRNAPVGPVMIKDAKVGGVTLTGEAVGIATNETGAFPNDRACSVEIADNISIPPAENVGAVTAEFVIGSNIYKINAVSKIMDAAPYIKNDRTYVPVRFLGYALGLTDEDIVWDASSQKATFTDGVTTVELTIGSTTITVNGEEQIMDVAPEISNDRTMLPARWVAEAFGARVGWDNVTRTVVIEN